MAVFGSEVRNKGRGKSYFLDPYLLSIFGSRLFLLLALIGFRRRPKNGLSVSSTISAPVFAMVRVVSIKTSREGRDATPSLTPSLTLFLTFSSITEPISSLA